MARLGRSSTTGWGATVAVSMSNYIEAGSIIAIATSLSAFQDAFGISNLGVGLLAALSSNALGGAVGAIVGGVLADRFGRKVIYTYDLLVYMVGVLLAAFAMDFTMLMLAFVITGLAVGVGIPTSWTYISEEAPTHARARRVGTAQLFWSVGPMLGYALAAVLSPLGLLGGRIVFLVLFVVAGIAWWIRQGLPESEAWVESRAAAAAEGVDASGAGEQPTFALKALFADRLNYGPLAFLFAVYLLWNIVAGQAGIFMPRIYEASGLTNETEQFWLQVFLWGMTVAATGLFMAIGDKVNRRVLFGVGAALGIVGWIVLVYGPVGPVTLVAFAVLWGVSSGLGAQAFYAVWASELFPTSYRASAQGVLTFATRGLLSPVSLLFPTLLAVTGLHGVGTLLIALLVGSMVIGLVFAPHTQGRSLEEIEAERYGKARARAGLSPLPEKVA
ncbi:MFS transporter [Nocardioides sp. GY 10127]|uniref:MFS transporter n=1 Tax=Nocardioides sp. GY 10127 TaxID=2569762 RepID=UPI0010A7A3A8|nr:MFS transporter [Nocardioides sp. GY 10127]TIC85542.1 MFS transporter [Nocardioides sp. GY 10127]